MSNRDSSMAALFQRGFIDWFKANLLSRAFVSNLHSDQAAMTNTAYEQDDTNSKLQCWCCRRFFKELFEFIAQDVCRECWVGIHKKQPENHYGSVSIVRATDGEPARELYVPS